MKFIKSKDIKEVGVSHNPDIKKKVFFGNDFIPKITIFGKAKFKPGQNVETHSYETMYEIFYILSGKAVFVINGKEIIAEKDSCVVIEPKELHSQNNPFEEDVEWVYYGVAVD